ncbi:MAG: HAD family hydrolase [Candidatus Altimarinota bacterium]
MSFSHFTTWLFDMDGTLVDSNDAVVSCMKKTVQEMGGEITDEVELRASFGKGLVNTLVPWVPEGKVPEAIEVYMKHFPEYVQKNLKLYDGVIELLDLLRQRDIAMGVVTGNKTMEAQGHFDHLQFGHYFPVVICADTIPFQKPSPEPVLEALRRLGKDPSTAVFIGDSEHDIRAGKLAGVKTIAVKGGSSPIERIMEAGPDWVLDSIGDVLKEIAA